jgi:hypothetical protein
MFTDPADGVPAGASNTALTGFVADPDFKLITEPCGSCWSCATAAKRLSDNPSVPDSPLRPDRGPYRRDLRRLPHGSREASRSAPAFDLASKCATVQSHKKRPLRFKRNGLLSFTGQQPITPRTAPRNDTPPAGYPQSATPEPQCCSARSHTGNACGKRNPMADLAG